MKENRVQATDGGNAGQVYMMAVFDTMELLRLESGSNKDYRTFIDEELRRVIPGEPAPQRAFIQAEVPDIEGFGRMAPRSRDLRQALSAVRNADGIIRRIVTLNEIIGCCQCGLDPLDPHDLELFYRHMERERVRTGVIRAIHRVPDRLTKAGAGTRLLQTGETFPRKIPHPGKKAPAFRICLTLIFITDGFRID